VQLEDIDVVVKSEHTKGGRAITPNGQRDLDLIAARIERVEEDEEAEEEEAIEA
jgi:ribosomal protein S19E (S16A)